MKKVYITSLHLQHGGVEMAITLMANALVKRGYAVTILNSYDLGEPAYALDSRVKLEYLTDLHPNRAEFKEALRRKNPVALLREGLYALRVLRQKKVTMQRRIAAIDEGIILSTRNEHTVMLSKYGRPGVRKIAQLHHDHRFDRKLLRDFAKNYQNIDHFVLLTELLAQEAKNMLGSNTHTQVCAIGNFLPQPPQRQPLPRQAQAIAVGRLHSVKGFDRLIELWAGEHVPMTLKIVGDGEQRPQLEALIRENRLEGKVILTGAMDHDRVMEEMARSQVYVMTSHTEGFPFVLIEAMQAGLPAVAYDVRVGPRAIIQQDVCGYLVPEDDRAAFAACVEKLAADGQLWQRLSQGALERSLCFTEDAIMEQWQKILEDNA